MQNRMISTELVEEDIKIENHLRPQMLSDYIGQEKVKENLKIFIPSWRCATPDKDHTKQQPPQAHKPEGAVVL